MKSKLITFCVILTFVPSAVNGAPHRKRAVPPHPAQILPEDERSYHVPYVLESSGTRAPIMQIPGSVVVVPRQVMDDQQDISICGAVRNVSGVMCR